MTDELVKGIRRIVGDPEDKPTGLSDAELRKAIGISRGVAYIGAGGAISGGGGEGAGNDTAPPVVPDPEANTTDPVPGDDGITDAASGSGSGNKTSLSGDVADVDDATKSNTKVDGVTGTDPTTGNITSVNFDTFAGVEYVPPDEWNSPTEPPSVQEGRSWVYTRSAEFGIVEDWYASREGLFADMQAQAPTIIKSYDPEPFSTHDPCVPAVIFGRNTCYYESWLVRFFAGGGSNSMYLVDTPSGITNNTGDIEWPSDSNCQVAYDYSANGYKGYELDPDCSTAQKTAATCVIIRSATQTSRYFRYCKLTDGGTKITEVDSGGTPVPGTVSKIMDAAGNVNSFFDVALDPFYT